MDAQFFSHSDNNLLLCLPQTLTLRGHVLHSKDCPDLLLLRITIYYWAHFKSAAE